MTDLIERFWKKVRKSDDCWQWTGSLANEYGSMRVEGKTRKATHLSLFIRDGVWPPADKCVCHTCDNPPCVNPDHLWIGTLGENNSDRHRKGRTKIQKVPIERMARGEAHGSAKLTEAQVLEIRSSTDKRVAIARRFNICGDTVRKIRIRKIWKHV